MTTESRERHAERRERHESDAGQGPSLFGRTARSAALLLVMRGLNAILLFLTGIALGRTLGPEQYGIYAFGAALLAVLVVPARLGIDNLLAAEIPALVAHGRGHEVGGTVQKALQLAVTVGTGILVGWGLLAFWRPGSLPGPLWKGGLIALIALPLLAALHVRLGALRGQHRVVLGQLPIFLIQPALMFGAVAICAVVLSNRLDGYAALALLSGSTAAACVLSFSARPSMLGPGRQRRASVRRTRELAFRALPYAVIGSMSVVMTHTGVLLLGTLSGEREAGLFQPAAQLSAMVVLGLQMINQPLGPRIAQLHARGSREMLQRLVDRAFWASGVLGLPVAVALIWGGGRALRLYGPEFEAAAGTLAILAVAQMVSIAFGPCALILMMTGTQKLLAWLLSSAAVLNVALAAWLIPTFGIEGAAWATLLTIALWNASTSYIAGRWYGIRSSFLMGWCVREEAFEGTET